MVEKQRGEPPAELIRDRMPEAAEHVWVWWCRMHAMRDDGAMGFVSIGWPAIDAFNRLLDLQMEPEEVLLLEVIEMEFRKHANNIETTDEDEEVLLDDDESAADAPPITPESHDGRPLHAGT